MKHKLFPRFSFYLQGSIVEPQVFLSEIKNEILKANGKIKFEDSSILHLSVNSWRLKFSFPIFPDQIEIIINKGNATKGIMYLEIKRTGEERTFYSIASIMILISIFTAIQDYSFKALAPVPIVYVVGLIISKINTFPGALRLIKILQSYGFRI